VNIGLRVWNTISISTKRELLVFCEVKTTHRLMKSAATASTSSGAELIAIYTPVSEYSLTLSTSPIKDFVRA
jgi:hypothetical protein